MDWTVEGFQHRNFQFQLLPILILLYEKLNLSLGKEVETLKLLAKNVNYWHLFPLICDNQLPHNNSQLGDITSGLVFSPESALASQAVSQWVRQSANPFIRASIGKLHPPPSIHRVWIRLFCKSVTRKCVPIRYSVRTQSLLNPILLIVLATTWHYASIVVVSTPDHSSVYLRVVLHEQQQQKQELKVQLTKPATSTILSFCRKNIKFIRRYIQQKRKDHFPDTPP